MKYQCQGIKDYGLNRQIHRHTHKQYEKMTLPAYAAGKKQTASKLVFQTRVLILLYIIHAGSKLNDGSVIMVINDP